MANATSAFSERRAAAAGPGGDRAAAAGEAVRGPGAGGEPEGLRGVRTHQPTRRPDALRGGIRRI